MQAAFEFVKYEIVNMKYALSSKPLDETDTTKLESKLSLSRNNDNPSLFRLGAEISVNDGKNISIYIQGYFKWHSEYIEDETEECLLTYGVNILYPYVRSTITSISVLDGGKPIIIPTINPFYDMKNNKTDNPR